jgi:hypothetical protein
MPSIQGEPQLQSIANGQVKSISSVKQQPPNFNNKCIPPASAVEISCENGMVILHSPRLTGNSLRVKT